MTPTNITCKHKTLFIALVSPRLSASNQGLSNKDLNLKIKYLICICNFRLCLPCSCLSSQFTWRKTFLARSAMLCVVYNQWSDDVAVAEVQTIFDLKPGL